ncbi:unnamed protein product, partial [Rotaria sp. Silwood2]
LSFIYPMTWSYYVVSILVGIGAAVLWAAQGVYLTNNSNDLTTSRNSGIFWALFQVSLLAGNVYIYISLKTEMIDSATRIPLFVVFSVVSAVAILYVLSFIYPMTWSYYVVSILVGIGAAVLWAAQGVYLTNNSNNLTASRS